MSPQAHLKGLKRLRFSLTLAAIGASCAMLPAVAIIAFGLFNSPDAAKNGLMTYVLYVMALGCFIWAPALFDSARTLKKNGYETGGFIPTALFVLILGVLFLFYHVREFSIDEDNFAKFYFETIFTIVGHSVLIFFVTKITDVIHTAWLAKVGYWILLVTSILIVTFAVVSNLSDFTSYGQAFYWILKICYYAIYAGVIIAVAGWWYVAFTATGQELDRSRERMLLKDSLNDYNIDLFVDID